MKNDSKIESLRRKAVKLAKEKERERLKRGYQTYNWTEEEAQLIINGRWPKGYEGHHMLSVNEYPEYAGDPDIIQWIPTPRRENGKKDKTLHLQAHGGNFKNPTHGFFDLNTGETIEFEDEEKPTIEKFEVKRKTSMNINTDETAPDEGVFFTSKKGGNTKGMEVADTLNSISGNIGLLTDALYLIDEMGISTDGLVQGLTAFQMVAELLTMSQTALNAVMALNPFVLVGIAAAALAAGLIYLWNTNEGFREALITAWEAIKEACSTVWGAIVVFFTEIIPTAVQRLRDCFTAYVEFWLEIWQQIGEFFANCWNGILSFAKENIPQFIDTVVSFISELPEKIWTWLSNVITKVGEWASGLISKAAEVMPGVVSNITGFFASLPEKLTNIGKNIVSGLWNGITGSASWLYDKIQSWCGGIIDNVKSFFGIHSPSTVMKDVVGVNLAKGVAEGITEGSSEITGAFSDTLSQLESEANGTGEALGIAISNIDMAVGHNMDEQSYDNEPGEELSAADRIRVLLEAAGKTIPEGFFYIGGMSAEQFGNGFEEKLRNIFARAQTMVSSFNSKMIAEITAGAELAASRANNIINNNTTYNQTYTVTSNGNSPKATADAIKNQQTLTRMLFA
ncbi:MAG: hypothetical protein IJ460_04495 [Clostridia bacterium]|nr:hypothetical protein [Clostridia bacterium]